MQRRSVSVSLIAGIRETQEMLDFCAEHGIVSEIGMIPVAAINESDERILTSDAQHRLVVVGVSLDRPSGTPHGAGQRMKAGVMDEGKFFVVGGEYADTTFATIADGKSEERHGPYGYAEARDVWRGLTGKTVDNALIRYRIKPESEIAGVIWHVAGGEYASTAFDRIASGHKLETYGPFSRPEALAVWRTLTSKSVDNAMVRYSIVTAGELGRLTAAHTAA